ncbi:hypothetical protein [Aquipseudomonas alcaligenes]|uniref:Uncharacterized protein n=1 Tax=Aquipseudomonas alcaligenes TaxID=43263 RepID=A0A1N6T888_AQUAC|nr:hypothetical protein [Pseudomonas alcaligenes]SIQ49605.1 hypothetical protein SAMN05878282_104362 [Pseudomonas alcaligenes]
MSVYFETGFSDPKAMILTLAGYILILCLPLAITYIATGLKGSLLRQIKLSAVALIIVVAGCFIFYGPTISYLALALAVLSLGFSVHQVLNRHKIEEGL